MENFINDWKGHPLGNNTLRSFQIQDRSLYLDKYGGIEGQRIFDFENAEDLDIDFITERIHSIHKNKGPGAILVFLPGWDYISTIHYNLTEEYHDHNYKDNKYYLDDVETHCLHSQIDMTKQREVFLKPKPGFRKVSTTICFRFFIV